MIELKGISKVYGAGYGRKEALNRVDLQLPQGEIVGLFGENGAVRQHGRSSLVLAAACTDTELLAMATDMAASVLKGDPTLTLTEHRGILEAAERFLKNSENVMN